MRIRNLLTAGLLVALLAGCNQEQPQEAGKIEQLTEDLDTANVKLVKVKEQRDKFMGEVARLNQEGNARKTSVQEKYDELVKSHDDLVAKSGRYHKDMTIASTKLLLHADKLRRENKQLKASLGRL